MPERVERTLPKDLNAEAAVLSAMLIDPSAVAKAIEKLGEEHFYHSPHKYIFRAISELFEENTEIDVITLMNRLERTEVKTRKGTETANLLEKAGGKQYIIELSDVVLSGANIEYHANIVLDKALLRMLIQKSTEIIESSYSQDMPIDDIIDGAEQAIFSIAERSNLKSFIKVTDIIPETLQNIEDVAANKTNVLGVPTGFYDLDAKTGGFRKGQFIVLAARPAMGKTALALNVAFNAAVHHNLKVAIFTMEMACEEILMRMLSSNSEVSMDNMLKGFGMTQDKLREITRVADAFHTKDIYIDDTGTNTALDIRAKSRRLKAELGGLDLIIIDYLQLMSSKRNRDNRQQEISEISRALKVLAKELGLPVIALSQLNRGLENRDDKRPRLADLRESGAIEQDADIVMFIYRDEYYNKESEELGIAEVIIGKNRHGAVGTVKLEFIGEITCFRNYDPLR